MTHHISKKSYKNTIRSSLVEILDEGMVELSRINHIIIGTKSHISCISRSEKTNSSFKKTPQKTTHPYHCLMG